MAVREPLLRRLAGFGSVVIETAAAGAGRPGTQRAEAMAPVVRPVDFDRVVQRAIPGLDVSLGEAPLSPPHPAELRRALARSVGWWSAIAAGATWLFGTWGAGLFAVVPFAALTAWLDWRHQGWLVTDRVVIARRGYLGRVTTVVARRKLQSTEVQQGPLLRRYALGSLVLRVAGSSVVMPVLGFDHALDLMEQLRTPGSV